LLVSYVALWILVGFFAIALFGLYHHFGEMYLNSRQGREQQGPAVGTTLKPSVAEDVNGIVRAVPPLAPSLMVFASTDCKLCGRLRTGIRDFAHRHPQLDVVVLCEGQASQVATWAEPLGSDIPVITDTHHRRASDYGIAMTPFVVGCGATGSVVLRGLINEIDGLELAAEELERDLTRRANVEEHILTPAPIGASS